VQLFLRFLREEAPKAERLYILGDFFEYWLGPKHLTLDEHREVLEALRSLSASGAGVFFIAGNRDFLFDPPTGRRFGITVLGSGQVVELDGRRFYITHGEDLVTPTRRHSIYCALVRNPVVTAMLKVLPVWVSKPLAERFRQLSTGRNKCARTRPGSRQLRRIGRRGVDEIVSGHLHYPEQVTLSSGTRLTLLGPWKEEGWFALWNGRQLQLLPFAPQGLS